MLLLNILIATVVVVCTHSHMLHNSQACPPAELITPCVCEKLHSRITVSCKGFYSEEDLKNAFKGTGSWSFQDLIIENSNFAFIPSSIFEHITFENLNVSSVTLISLFDEPLKPNTNINIYLFDIKILRGIQWDLLTDLNPVEFGAINADIKKFGQSFKDGMTKTVKHVWFENTKTDGLVDGAFEKMKDLSLFVIRNNHLTSIKRNIFAKPSKLFALYLSFNKIQSLPNDMFEDMPDIKFFVIDNNLLTTVSEKIFIKKPVWYYLKENPLNCDCNLKWTTVEGNVISSLLEGTCAKPSILKGKEIKDLKKEDFSYCT